ncbi:winged helix-turn-helix transcriptional regulator [Tsukamurella soli]|uniref:HTH hxlR-type domain-containing protein n=1 Tax=Tsukamurella soli TaxID=644556 RepID=A0ABP8K7X8_9ACTN
MDDGVQEDRRGGPLPGRPVRGSESGRPVMAAFDLLGRRWALSILWELRFGQVRFSGLRDRIDGMSPSTLSQRLTELTEARIVTPTATGYRLTVHGRSLLLALGPLELWAQTWAHATGD